MTAIDRLRKLCEAATPRSDHPELCLCVSCYDPDAIGRFTGAMRHALPLLLDLVEAADALTGQLADAGQPLEFVTIRGQHRIERLQQLLHDYDTARAALERTE